MPIECLGDGGGGTVETENKISTTENPELSKMSPFELRVIQTLRSLPAEVNSAFPISTLLVHSTRFFVFVLVVWGCCSCFSILFLRLFPSLWPFQLYFIPSILPTALRFLTLFFRSYLCLIGPFNLMSVYESLLQP